MKNYLLLLRPHQYVKNTVIFLPAFFALRITETALLLQTGLVCLAFCLLASAVYILNDYKDVERDRLHPEKKYRPLAAGTIPTSNAFVLMGLLMVISLSLFAWIDLKVLYIALAYLTLNIFYSFKLKHISLLDICIIALGFVIRILLGATVGEIELTLWIILMTFLLALFLGLAKRRDDVLLSNNGTKVRKAIDGYNLTFINGAMMVMASVLIVAYILYTTSIETRDKFSSDYLYITVLFVILGILRYLQITFVEEKSGNPTKILLQDTFLQATILGWLLTFVLILYI